jgi:hypothetical protein
MKLIHTTMAANQESILEYGILQSYCRAGNGRVWLHDESVNGWAENHVRSIHDAPDADLIHITVDVPRSALRKHSGSMYYVLADILPDQFISAVAVWTQRQTISLEGSKCR